MNAMASGGVWIRAVSAALLIGWIAAHAAQPVPAEGAKTARPQDDLFNAVNGAWLAQTEIPADKSSWGVWDKLSDDNDRRLRTILDEWDGKPPAGGSEEAKLSAMYRAFIDEAAIDAAGTKPLAERLVDIDAIASRRDLAAYLGRNHGVADAPMRFAAEPDYTDPTRYAAVVWQSGLGLPDRDYYLGKDERFAKARRDYQTYLTTLAQLIGLPDAPSTAKQVLALETRLARAQRDRVSNRDPKRTYNPMPLATLVKRAPGLDWAAWFAAAEVATDRPLVLAQPDYARALARLAGSEPLALWKSYAKLRAADAAATVLPAPFRDAEFAFYGKALRGQTAPRPRWQQSIDAVNGAMGEALGRIYVQRHFPPAHKARMQQMVDRLMAAYGESIDGLTWMQPATRKKAREKLALYRTKIGYPARWRDYSALDIREADAFGNRQRAGRFEWLHEAAKVGKPVDRDEWGMTPQTVNAYYNPSQNEIVFPAAILQPPFFDMTADDAANYGAIGAIIGHEISHGFDDYGSQFDGLGRLRNWWSPADRKAFDAIGAKLVAQYNGYEPLPGKHLNGQLTLGENIADLSGLQIAWKAWRASLEGRSAPVMNGVPGEQRFFIGWATAWQEKTRDERALELLVSDEHSPSAFRANGAAVNHDGFHEAFRTQPQDRMYKAPGARIRIW
jgi:putative endopeptidase